jgi:prepilin-type N-terminal cleavage/methylation domain-containing protein
MRRDEAGFTLMEMMVTMAITLVILAGTMKAMSDAMRSNETAQLTTSMNRGLRTSADIMVRDLLQVGQGMPAGHVIQIPQGGPVTAIKLPAAPGTMRAYDSTATEISAVIPGPGLGPTVNGVPTDLITTLAIDSAFDTVKLTALTTTSMTVDPSVTITGTGPNVIRPGDLLMLVKGTTSTLVEVTSLTGQYQINFAAGDSLNLNQVGDGTSTGTVQALLNTNPPDVVSPTFIPTTTSRVRMISYYLDATTEPARPRLDRRMNNGSSTTYDNTLGTAVAFDVENLQFSFDLVDGVANPANVKMNANDLSGIGACSPNACNPNQIRKVNITVSGRSRVPMKTTNQFFRNTVDTQVSFRSLSFVDRYK